MKKNITTVFVVFAEHKQKIQDRGSISTSRNELRSEATLLLIFRFLLTRLRSKGR